MFKSHSAVVLFTSLALLAGSSPLLAGTGGGRGGHGGGGAAPQWQMPRGGNQQRPGGQPAHDVQMGGAQWRMPRGGNQQRPGGYPARDAQAGGAQWRMPRGDSQQRPAGQPARDAQTRASQWRMPPNGYPQQPNGQPLPGTQARAAQWPVPPNGTQQWPAGQAPRDGRVRGPHPGEFRGDGDRMRGGIGERGSYRGPGTGLPPGVRMNLERGKPLPPGIARQQVDSGMASRLPHLDGYEWTRVGPDLVQVSQSTGIVNQVMSGMVP